METVISQVNEKSTNKDAPTRSARIAIVGRPNVGKSTIFNRLIKRRKAIESETPGTTRDRVTEKFRIDGMAAQLIDTAGLYYEGDLEDDVKMQAYIAIAEADVILFVMSAADELTVTDFSVVKILREAKKPTILVANKCDNKQLDYTTFNLCELGFGEPIQLSAVHKRGFDVLTNQIAKLLRAEGFTNDTSPKKSNELSLCLIGRPNVGKSSFFNSLVGEKRSIVSEIPGTTRDEVDTLVVRNGVQYRLVDTAGIRRKGKVGQGIEGLSVLRSLSAVERSDIIFLLIDYKDGVTNQDMHVVEEAMKAGKGIVLVVNKTDLMPKGEEAKMSFVNYLQKKCAFLSFAPVLFTSALTGKNVDKIYALADQIHAERIKRIPTAELNAFFKKVVAKRGPHGTKNIKPKLLYATQVDVEPPHFVLFVNQEDSFHFSYKRYMENQLRVEYGFTGTVIRMDFRSRVQEA
ncbi:MAG: ribosome biogenesis GTPase Der [Candidatus Peregrinibacteria bacterium]|nr:ribosome biogenesis GTPase Der [Candidatus Peregrinibacteria bacterium]MDZ4245109.1 ribosome biogenesis GTPase Der [Candidatus Gracilibacteria bacterium]